MRDQSGLHLATVLSLTLLTASTAYAALGDCGQPVTNGSSPTATDCLYILKSAVGAQTCSPECICDVNAAGGVTATDALTCLKKAVGQNVTLDCGAGCAATTTTTTTLTPNPFAGTYSGRATGDDQDVCTFSVGTDGSVDGHCYSIGLESGFSLSGSVDAGNGHLDASASIGGDFTGQLKNNGTGSGSWSDGGNSGSWTAFKHTGATPYVGAYAGAFSGDNSGPIAFTVDESRQVRGFGAVHGEGVLFNLTGSVSTNGGVSVNPSTGGNLTGTMSTSGNASGSWSSSGGGGSWSASRLP